MKRTIATSAVLVAFAAAFAALGGLFDAWAQDDPKPATALDSKQRKAGYAWGFGIGRKLKNDLDLADLDAVLAGLRDGAVSAEPRLTSEEMEKEAEALNAEIGKRGVERAKKEGPEFLANNAKKEGVKVTASGLQYRVLVEGSGKKPDPNSVVKVHYEGKLLDGTVFDSSYKRDEPAQFPLNRVIPGWSEGLQLMKVGSKYELYIPSSLGYGPRGAGGVIPPHATLIFKVELLEVN